MKSDKIPLYTIAKCDLTDHENSLYWIPNIQRGLVWKAIQMELLWDSILRGFPIGSMLILEQGPNRGEILDGQQRANAIIAGFNIDSLLGDKQKPNTIIWIDLAFEPSESDKERRRFGIRVTNSSHPWGFDEEGGTLSAQDRRDSIELAYDCSRPHNKSEWDIRRFIPFYYQKQIESKFMPVPLAILVNAAEGLTDNSNEIYWRKVKDSLLEFSKYAPSWKNHYLTDILNQIEQFLEPEKDRFFNAFLGLNTYEVVFNYVTSNDDIELLFNRVNRRGTPTTAHELTYAAIKHYGEVICDQPEIGHLIKECSNGLMMEHIFAQIAFRYCFSDERIHGDISAEQIRALAFSEKKGKNELIKDNLKSFFDKTKLSEKLARVEEILLSSPDGSSKLPNYIIAEIATRSPEIIILLLSILDNNGNLFEDKNDLFVQALIFYLYCFSTNKETVRKTFEVVRNQSCSDVKNAIRNILRDSISHGWSMPPISSFKDFPAFNESNFNNTWNIEKFIDAKGFSFFQKLFVYETYQGCFMLKFALNDYYEKAYSDYNPSLREYWEDINCPWDHDHIIPRNWIQDNDWSKVLGAWINSTGNIADIPFEENRSKSDKPDFHYYYENRDELLFNDDFAKLDPQMLGQGIGAVQLMKLVKNRFLSISSKFLYLFSVLSIENTLSPLQQKRKDFIEYLLNKYDNGAFHDYQLYYRGESNKVILCECDNSNYVLQRPCLLLIRKGDNEWRRAISIAFNDYDTTDFRIEIGFFNIAESTWKDGSMLARNSALFNNKHEIEPLVSMLINGAEKMNEEYGLNGFETNSISILSYKTIVNNTNIVSYLYTYYGCCYCTIKTIDDKDLPQSILDKFTREMGFEWRTDTSIDCRLFGKNYNPKYNIDEVCKKFGELMKELQSLTLQSYNY